VHHKEIKNHCIFWKCAIIITLPRTVTGLGKAWWSYCIESYVEQALLTLLATVEPSLQHDALRPALPHMLNLIFQTPYMSKLFHDKGLPYSGIPGNLGISPWYTELGTPCPLDSSPLADPVRRTVSFLREALHPCNSTKDTSISF
jgi:hypothetical protein